MDLFIRTCRHWFKLVLRILESGKSHGFYTQSIVRVRLTLKVGGGGTRTVEAESLFHAMSITFALRLVQGL